MPYANRDTQLRYIASRIEKGKQERRAANVTAWRERWATRIQPDLVNLMWAVGFLEGEGSFCVNKGGTNPRAQVSCPQAERSTLERLHRIFGVGGIGRPISRGSNKPLWYWTVHKNEDALWVMEVVYPHMSTRRRQQIEYVLETASPWDQQRELLTPPRPNSGRRRDATRA